MGTRTSGSAAQFVEGLLGKGRYTFTREEAARRLRRKPAAVYMALHRLAKAGRLAMPRSGFYVAIDPQHRPARILPPEWFIDGLMRDIGRPYYVGLLSAAQLHGAAHHQPQEFQVVVPGNAIRPVRAGNVLIRFHRKGRFDASATQDIKTTTGFMKVSTPETTAWDLVWYSRSAGGLDNVVTVLAELGEKLDAGSLSAAAKRHGDAETAQRLGYLLDRAGRGKPAKGLANIAKGAPLCLLDPASPAGKPLVARKWRVLVNVRLEPES